MSLRAVPLRSEERVRTVLMVEDDPDLSGVFGILLAHDRLRIEVAANGAEAIRKARQLRPDVVVLDVMLPILSGLEVCRTIRGDRTLADTPVIFLTGYSGPKALEEARALGAIACFMKPFQPAELRAAVLSAAGLADAAAGDDGPAAPPQLRVIRGGLAPRERIALIEPDARVADDVRALVEEGFGDRVEVVHYTSGVEAIERISAAPPDVVLLSADLRDVNPVNVLRLVRRDPRLRDTAVIALGGDARPRSQEALLAAGVSSWCMKPIDGVALEAVIRDGLAERRFASLGAGQPTGPRAA